MTGLPPKRSEKGPRIFRELQRDLNLIIDYLASIRPVNSDSINVKITPQGTHYEVREES